MHAINPSFGTQVFQVDPCGFNLATSHGVDVVVGQFAGEGFDDDIGDIEVHPEVVLEVKDRRKLELSAWVAKLNVQKANKDSAYAFLGIKLHGKSNAEDWAYLIDGATLINILRLIRKQ